MTAFTIGMLAAALWFVAIVALILLTRRAPGAPSKSVREFRRARRSLLPTLESKPSVRISSETELQWSKPSPAPASDSQEGEDNHEFIFEFEAAGRSEPGPQDISEDPDLNRVLESITAPSPPETPRSKPRSPRPKKPSPAQRGPRKAAGVSYILVDETGKPLL